MREREQEFRVKNVLTWLLTRIQPPVIIKIIHILLLIYSYSRERERESVCVFRGQKKRFPQSHLHKANQHIFVYFLKQNGEPRVNSGPHQQLHTTLKNKTTFTNHIP